MLRRIESLTITLLEHLRIRHVVCEALLASENALRHLYTVTAQRTLRDRIAYELVLLDRILLLLKREHGTQYVLVVRVHVGLRVGDRTRRVRGAVDQRLPSRARSLRIGSVACT